MKFCDKVRVARTNANLTQQELSEMIGVSLRTITNYETGDRYPKKREIYNKLADALKVDINYLLTENEEFTLQAQKEYGIKGKTEAQLLINQASALFAGGELEEEDQEAFFQAMTEIYFDAKKKAKKYTPTKYRKQD